MCCQHQLLDSSQQVLEHLNRVLPTGALHLRPVGTGRRRCVLRVLQPVWRLVWPSVRCPVRRPVCPPVWHGHWHRQSSHSNQPRKVMVSNFFSAIFLCRRLKKRRENVRGVRLLLGGNYGVSRGVSCRMSCGTRQFRCNTPKIHRSLDYLADTDYVEMRRYVDNKHDTKRLRIRLVDLRKQRQQQQWE